MPFFFHIFVTVLIGHHLDTLRVGSWQTRESCEAARLDLGKQVVEHDGLTADGRPIIGLNCRVDGAQT